MNSEEKKELIIDLLKILNLDINDYNDIFKIQIDFETLKDGGNIEKLYRLIPKYKKNYNSNMLTCLHKNSKDKQTFPAINFIRQILKCNKLKLKGRYICMGNNKITGKKILKRIYEINEIKDISEEQIVDTNSLAHQES